MAQRESADDATLDQLRELLLHSDRRELEELRARVDELASLDPLLEIEKLKGRVRELEAEREVALRTERVGEVLPAAIQRRRSTKNDLTNALRPDVEQAMHDSIRRDPQVMAEALYPVMGPTIRKLIVSLFSFDQMRPGAKYRISNAYLIDRRTSLPLAVHAPGDDALEADMVSGMMEALRSFVQDAFEAKEFDGLRDLSVGDVNLWVEWGPRAVLAVVVRGQPPDTLRLEMQETLEDLHREYEVELEHFAGDSTPFEPVEPRLGQLTERLTDLGVPSTIKRLQPIIFLVVLALVVAGVVWLIVA